MDRGEDERSEKVPWVGEEGSNTLMHLEKRQEHLHSRLETLASSPVPLWSGNKSSESSSFAGRQTKISN